jgi:glycosyltransferase involved in cell wall biosynthesis
MKILHVLRDLSRNGGVQRLVFDMAMSGDPDLEISVLITKRESGAEYIDELRKNGITVHLIPRWNLLAHYLLYRQFDIVHAHLFPALYLVGLLASKKVYTEHNTNNNRRNLPMARLIETFVYGRFEAITCITPEVESCLCAFLRVKTLSNSCVVYNGVDTQNFNKQKISRGDGGCNIAMIGSLTDKKDQETIIRALTQLDESYIFHLAGDGERREYLADLATELGVEDRVEFHGLINDIPSFLATMDLYVQSSKFEGFGLAAVEAMAAGLPTLCADVPGLKELTGSELNLFPQGNSEILAQKILSINENKKIKVELLSIGIDTCNRFSLQNMNSKFHDVYAGLIK